MALIWVCNTFMGADISPNFAVMVPAGMESGADVLIGKEGSHAMRQGHYYWSDDVVEEVSTHE